MEYTIVPIYTRGGRVSVSRLWGVGIGDEAFQTGKDGIFLNQDEDLGTVQVTIYNELISQKVTAQRLSNIHPSISTLELWPRYSRLKQEATYQNISVIRNSEALFISWNIGFHFAHWKESFSINDYLDEFLSILQNSGQRFQREVDSRTSTSQILILFPVEDKNATIDNEFLRHVDEVLKFERITNDSLASKPPRSKI